MTPQFRAVRLHLLVVNLGFQEARQGKAGQGTVVGQGGWTVTSLYSQKFEIRNMAIILFQEINHFLRSHFKSAYSRLPCFLILKT